MTDVIAAANDAVKTEVAHTQQNNFATISKKQLVKIVVKEAEFCSTLRGPQLIIRQKDSCIKVVRDYFVGEIDLNLAIRTLGFEENECPINSIQIGFSQQNL